MHQHSNNYTPSKTKRLVEKLKWSTITDGRVHSKRYLIGAGYDEKAVRKYYKPDHPAPLSDILRKAESIIEKISVDDDRINEIENATREQSRNSQWHAERFPRITASKCKRALIKETTSLTKAMQEILCYNKAFQSQYMMDESNQNRKLLINILNAQGMKYSHVDCLYPSPIHSWVPHQMDLLVITVSLK